MANLEQLRSTQSTPLLTPDDAGAPHSRTASA